MEQRVRGSEDDHCVAGPAHAVTATSWRRVTTVTGSRTPRRTRKSASRLVSRSERRRPETLVEQRRMQGQGAAGFALRAFFVRARRHQKGRQERTKAVELYTVGIHDAGLPSPGQSSTGRVGQKSGLRRHAVFGRAPSRPSWICTKSFLCSAARSLPPLLMPYSES